MLLILERLRPAPIGGIAMPAQRKSGDEPFPVVKLRDRRPLFFEWPTALATRIIQACKRLTSLVQNAMQASAGLNLFRVEERGANTVVPFAIGR